MEEQTMQLLNESILPVNGTTITLADKMLMMDTLSFPLSMTGAQSIVERFPIKLTRSCLLIVENGTVRLNVNFRDSVVTAGCCAFIGQEAIVETVEVEGDTRVILIMFSHNHLPAMPSIFQDALQVFACKLQVEHMTMLKQVYYMMRTILQDSAFAPNREESAAGCLNLMASIIGQGNGSQRAVKASRADEIVSGFLKCVQENYREHRELGFYADQLGLSLKYMSHVIYEKTGRHPSKWIKDYVILEAKTMLRSGRYSIQQIAEELHFPNQSFFGKYFKETVGVSPKKWK
jgi:AraC-like DNA-binding protein